MRIARLIPPAVVSDARTFPDLGSAMEAYRAGLADQRQSRNAADVRSAANLRRSRSLAGTRRSS